MANSGAKKQPPKTLVSKSGKKIDRSSTIMTEDAGMSFLQALAAKTFVTGSGKLVTSKNAKKELISKAGSTTVRKLPQGWVKDYDDKQNAVFYRNEETGEKSWQEPQGTRSMKEVLPRGWIKDFDTSKNCVYYYNETKDETSWVPPPGTFVE